MSWGIDRLTTSDVTTSEIGLASMVLAGLVGLILGVRNWFGLKPELSARMPLGWLRRDRVGVWSLIGVVYMLIIMSGLAFICREFLGIGAQYLEGSTAFVDGVVTSDRLTYTPATVCKRRIVVRKDLDGENLSICLSTNLRGSLSTSALRQGQLVRIKARNTRLGQVILSVEPSS